MWSAPNRRRSVALDLLGRSFFHEAIRPLLKIYVLQQDRYNGKSLKWQTTMKHEKLLSTRQSQRQIPCPTGTSPEDR